MKRKAYARAGVDIDLGNKVKSTLPRLLASTHRPEVLGKVGGFGGLFALDIRKYRQPVLVASVDGVGTKLKIAFAMNRHDTIGADLVNHCVNDILVQGAVPLFFLDYLATGRLSPDVAEQIVEGLARACTDNGCALLGGETAEMPGFYAEGEYDVAGFIVGAVDRERIIDGRSIGVGDVLIGLPGVHGKVVRHDARAGLRREEPGTQLDVHLRQQVHGDDGRLVETGIEEVPLIERDPVGNARALRVLVALRDALGIDIHAEAAGAVLPGGRDHNAAIPRAEIDQVVLRERGALGEVVSAEELVGGEGVHDRLVRGLLDHGRRGGAEVGGGIVVRAARGEDDRDEQCRGEPLGPGHGRRL